MNTISQEIQNIKEQYIQLEHYLSELIQKQSTLLQLMTTLLNENNLQKQQIEQLENQLGSLAHLVSEPSTQKSPIQIEIKPWTL